MNDNEKQEQKIFNQAVECYKQKKYSKAIDYFTQVIEILEKNGIKDKESQLLIANAYFNRGINKYELHKLKNDRTRTDNW